MSAGSESLVDLLGETRAKVVHLLRERSRRVADIAQALGLSEVAVRRHLQVLEGEDLVTATTVHRDGPGRPSASYRLTEKARRLFPDQSAAFASELLEYLEQQHGRRALLGFLRWRQARQGARYAAALAPLAADDTRGRAEQLARLLDDDGFLSEVAETVVPDGAAVLELKQGHCAVRHVAEAHPEICAYEAALFKELLGDAKISRRRTIAAGANECVCVITPKDPPEDDAPRDDDTAKTGAGHHGYES